MLRDPTYNPRREQLEEKLYEMENAGILKGEKLNKLKENI